MEGRQLNAGLALLWLIAQQLMSGLPVNSHFLVTLAEISTGCRALPTGQVENLRRQKPEKPEYPDDISGFCLTEQNQRCDTGLACSEQVCRHYRRSFLISCNCADASAN